MGPDAGVAQGYVQQTPNPGAYIPGYPDGGTCGAILHVPLTGQTIPIDMDPFPVNDNIPGEEEISEAVL